MNFTHFLLSDVYITQLFTLTIRFLPLAIYYFFLQISPSLYLKNKQQTFTSLIIGVTRKIFKNSNSVDKPKKGDEVIIKYIGYLYDKSNVNNNYRGKEWVIYFFNVILQQLLSYEFKFDSFKSRKNFKIAINIEKVIRDK